MNNINSLFSSVASNGFVELLSVDHVMSDCYSGVYLMSSEYAVAEGYDGDFGSANYWVSTNDGFSSTVCDEEDLHKLVPWIFEA